MIKNSSKTNISLNTLLTDIKGINKKYHSILQSQRLITIYDLLKYYPYRYHDYSQLVTISQIRNINSNFHFKAVVSNLNTKNTIRRKLHLTSCYLVDDSGKIKANWFNNRYINHYLQEGQEYIFFSQPPTTNNYGMTITNPKIITIDQFNNQKLISPVYSETNSLTSKWFSSQINKYLYLTDALEDHLPPDIVKKYHLLTLAQSIKLIHQPTSQEDICLSRHRLGFNEVFWLNLATRINQKKLDKAFSKPINVDLKKIKSYIEKLPFTLTNYQKRVLWDIFQDLQKNKPMHRLLEGDVGSGKTIIAALSMAIIVHNNSQSVLVAPTEVLAGQHLNKIIDYLSSPEFDICLLTGSQSLLYHKHEIKKVPKRQLIKSIKKGSIKTIIATHAILESKIEFEDLNLVIFDEQHRFGINQRNALTDRHSKHQPHLLTMSATPIPRSLALVLYGQISLSVIKSQPKDRLPIITKIIHPDNRLQIYDFIRQQVNLGHQIFIICPLVEESEKIQIKSAIAEYEKLKKDIFPNISVGLLHGRLKSEEKENIMHQFQKNKISILVSTSVIEVGIDIPNATVIIIEGSERFGLSQLHQFRGRVGRSHLQSYCFLFTDLPSPKVIQRLKVLVEYQDGFSIAEEDLKLRGPGELMGFRQSGIADLRMASISDAKLLEQVHQATEYLLDKDPTLSRYPLILKNLQTQKIILS